MPQGTVKSYDKETATGTLLLDSQEEVSFDAPTFLASGLRELRLGQRVRLEIEAADEGKRVTMIDLVSF